MVEKIILVFKTHFDIGFTDLSKNVVEKYATTMLDEVIRTCDATAHLGRRKYVWTMPAWPVKIIAEQCDAGRKRELDRLIANGQIVWHALPFTSHTDFCSVEELHEGLRFARQLSKTYGKPYPVSAKMTDVPGHGIHLPAVLSGAGVKFLHLGCNEFASPPAVPFLFWWQSPDGERVLTMYSPNGYGTGLCPPPDWPYPVWMALMQTDDNCGPQTADAIGEMAAEIRLRHPDAEVVCGTMDEFWADLSACGLSDVPVVTEDLADTWIHGVGAYPVEVGRMRANRERNRRVQALLAKRALAHMVPAGGRQGHAGPSNPLLAGRATWGPEQAPPTGNGGGDAEAMALLDRYAEESILFGEHTWGADVKTWMGPGRVYRKRAFEAARSSEPYLFMEASWREQRDRAACCTALLDMLEHRAGFGKAGPATEGAALFNPHADPFTGWVPLSGNDADSTDHPFEGRRVEVDGQPMPLCRIHGQWCGFARNLPPFSETAVRISPNNTGTGAPDTSASWDSSAPDALVVRDAPGGAMVENHRYRLLFSQESGDVLELYDKALRRPLLRQHGEVPVFSYRYDRYGADDITEYLRAYAWRFSPWGVKDNGREAYPECGHRMFRPLFRGMRIEGDSIVFRYDGPESVGHYGDARHVELTVTLPPAGDEVFVEIRLQDKQETPFVESGSLRFPLAFDKPVYRIGKANTELDPATDIREGANHALYCVESHVSAFDGTAGVCVVPCDSPLAALGETGILTYRRKWREPESPVLHANLFNNMWGTNFPQWIGGTFRSRFVLFGFDARARQGVAERAAMLMEGVGLTAADDVGGQERGSAHDGAADVTIHDGSRLVPPAHMQLISARQEADGWMLVFRDLSGVASERVLSAGGCAIQPVDLAGRATGGAEAGLCRFRSKPGGIHAFLLTPRKELS